MTLEIRHNRAEHTHENEQFRRVASNLRALFEQNSWNGLLIGNPFNENFGRFRADAILLYDHGLVVIDFKDYSGTITLPEGDNSFRTSKWYTENQTDKQRIEIKAGARFINPFRQLHSYRGEMFEVVRNNIYLNKVINPSRTLALNIFSGPIQIENSVPKSIPYYKIVQEADLLTMLYDYSSDNKFSDDSAHAFNTIFPADEWQERVVVAVEEKKANRSLDVTGDVKEELGNFLKQNSARVLLLESMDADTRDEWMRYILSEAVEFGVPQTETWCHSSRIARKIAIRSGVNLQSLYSTIYGSSGALDEGPKNEDSTDEEKKEDHFQEVVPVRSSTNIDESAVVVLHEAHLVTRSLHQSEILKFGTGRLLEDLTSFLKLDTTRRKLICIGDPYSLSYGSSKECALSAETLQELTSAEVKRFRSPLTINSKMGKTLLRISIASQIEMKAFNHLDYPWEDGNLVNVDKGDTATILLEWFGSPCNSEPQKAVLVYSNKKDGAQKINKWIKRNCLNNGDKLAKGDLIVINNNINIPDPTGFGQPTKLYNGMYLLVKAVGEVKQVHEKIKVNKTEKIIPLNFLRLSVSCLSVHGIPDAEVWLLDNDFSSEEGLSKEEQIALRVFVNKKVTVAVEKNPFEDSLHCKWMKQSDAFQETIKDINELRGRLSEGEQVKTKLDDAERKLRVIQRGFKTRHRQSFFAEVVQTDPFVNAVLGSYGWALTVHKAVGSSFSHVLLNANQGESRGVDNLGYFRWLYSGLTAANGVAYVVNPVYIHPLQNCIFEDVAASGGGNGKRKLTFTDYVPNEIYRGKLPGKLKSSVVGTICEFTKFIECEDFVLGAVYSHGDYLTKVNYSLKNQPGSQLVLAIDNKGEKAEWAVTSIRIERADGLDKSQIAKSIERFCSGAAAQRWNIPDDFRREIYQNWKDTLGKDSLSLSLAESSHDWQDIFEVSDKESNAQFRVWYDGKGFINKVSVFQKSGDEIVGKLNTLVTQWNQSSN
jgi:hypothetical protein